MIVEVGRRSRALFVDPAITGQPSIHPIVESARIVVSMAAFAFGAPIVECFESASAVGFGAARQRQLLRGVALQYAPMSES
jgi:hypothetical protein